MASIPDTHIERHPSDPNDFIIVTNSLEKVTNNFTQSELFNKKVGQNAHWISKDIVECVQLIRDWYGIPIQINSSYRNYVPSGAGVVGAVKNSPHMIACALDFKFLTDSEKADNLYMQIRDDFDRRGALFQALWDRGCRGFGSYDTFIHLDTVKSELYPAFDSKRKRTKDDEKYAVWNSMSRLFYRSPSFIVSSAEGYSNDLQVEPMVKENVVVEKTKEVVGAVRGVINDLGGDEDAALDYNTNNKTKTTIAALLVTAVVFGIYRVIKLFV